MRETEQACTHESGEGAGGGSFFLIYFLRERERERERVSEPVGEEHRERGRERIPSKLCGASSEPMISRTLRS